MSNKLNEKEKQYRLEMNTFKSELESKKTDITKYIDRCDELKIKNNQMSRGMTAIKSEYKKVACERNALKNEVGVLRLKLEQFNSGEKLFGYDNFSK
jgi:uncharacterized coiled-coil DUF342 family protein